MNARTYKSKYAHIGNSLSALNKAGQASVTGTTRYYDGGSPTAIWAVRSAGIDPATGKELFIKKDGSYSFDYDVNDEVVVGDTQPKLEGVLELISVTNSGGRYSIQTYIIRWRIST